MTSPPRRVAPNAMSAEIKALFLANDRSGAALWFDRNFADGRDSTASSWVSTTEDGRVVAHVAALPMRLVHGGREASGSLFCNLMADQSHRTFFPILSVVKRAVSDLRSDGTEFIATNPSNAGAIAVMRAAGLRQVAMHNRFLYPLGHRNPGIDLLVGAHLLVRRLLVSRVRADEIDVAAAADWTVRHLAGTSSLTARRVRDQYAMRYEAFGSGNDLAFLLRDAQRSEIGAAIVRREPTEASASLITLRCTAGEHVSGSITAIASALRALGDRRLSALAVVGSPFARSLVRGGCIPRQDPCAIVGTGFTDAGRGAIAALGTSDLERVDFD